MVDTIGRSRPAAPSDPLAGTRYEPLRRLGAGGMGEIFEARDRSSGRTVVVKLIHPGLSTNPKLIERFRIEAQALAVLQHPNIVAIEEFGATAEGQPFLAMERLHGKTLAQELREHGPLRVHEAVARVCHVLSGLEIAHRVGIVHRDIKLDNLFVCGADVGTPVVKVLDFGIAKLLRSSSIQPSAYPTEKGVIIGTPKYVSPEQVFGRPVDERSDLYAAGLVLFSLLTGRGPFDHIQKDAKLLAAHAKLEPDPPSRWAPRIPPALDRAVLKALEKNPERRFQSAAAFRAELEHILRESGGEVAFLTTQLDWRAPASLPQLPAETPDVEPVAPEPTRTRAPETPADLDAERASAAVRPAQVIVVLLFTAAAVAAILLGLSSWLD